MSIGIIKMFSVNICYIVCNSKKMDYPSGMYEADVHTLIVVFYCTPQLQGHSRRNEAIPSAH